jgi:hypothetical protein
MKSVLTLAYFAFIATAHVASHAEDASRSVALVRAMRSDEIAAAATKSAFLSGAAAERYGQVGEACVKRVSHTDFTAGWARIVETVLSPQEIDDSLKFYQSDAGVKYVEGMLRRMRARQGKDTQLPRVSANEEIAPAQLAEIAAFTRSDVGRKVTGKDLTLSPAADAFGREMLAKIAERCRKG